MSGSLSLSFSLVSVLLLCSCGGASPQQVKMASEARYQCPKDRMSAVLSEEVSDRFSSLEVEDADNLRFVTAKRPFSSIGAIGNPNDVKTGDYIVSVDVRMVEHPDGRFGLAIDDEVYLFAGAARSAMQAEELPAGDPRRPDWLAERKDELTLAVFERLRDCSDRPAAGQ